MSSITQNVYVLDCSFYIRVSSSNDESEKILEDNRDKVNEAMVPLRNLLIEIAREAEDRKKNRRFEF